MQDSSQDQSVEDLRKQVREMRELFAKLQEEVNSQQHQGQGGRQREEKVAKERPKKEFPEKERLNTEQLDKEGREKEEKQQREREQAAEKAGGSGAVRI
jgi:hypothetical protein